ncbi:hypothetical protein LX36DRAFT_317998 [Colletotrichum falcatum]|nr:hypothetical protein LX36DRAFT_317998 [Colletotrichum falcatum]
MGSTSMCERKTGGLPTQISAYHGDPLGIWLFSVSWRNQPIQATPHYSHHPKTSPPLPLPWSHIPAQLFDPIRFRPSITRTLIRPGSLAHHRSGPTGYLNPSLATVQATHASSPQSSLQKYTLLDILASVRLVYKTSVPTTVECFLSFLIHSHKSIIRFHLFHFIFILSLQSCARCFTPLSFHPPVLTHKHTELRSTVIL